MAKILIIEDDRDTAEDLALWLESENHLIDVVHNGEEALAFTTSGFYQLILLDWELPGLSGLELLKRISETAIETPVLMITGRTALSDKIQGLDSGAHDYLTKPYLPDELTARVRALLRRQASTSTAETRSFGNLTLQPDSYDVRCNGTSLNLRKVEFKCLDLLLAHVNKSPLSTEILLRRLWGREGSADAVRTTISTLRKKLKESGANMTINNSVGFGYRIVLQDD